MLEIAVIEFARRRVHLLLRDIERAVHSRAGHVFFQNYRSCGAKKGLVNLLLLIATSLSTDCHLLLDIGLLHSAPLSPVFGSPHRVPTRYPAKVIAASSRGASFTTPKQYLLEILFNSIIFIYTVCLCGTWITLFSIYIFCVTFCSLLICLGLTARKYRDGRCKSRRNLPGSTWMLTETLSRSVTPSTYQLITPPTWT